MAVSVALAGRRRELQLVTDVLMGAADVAALLVVADAGVGKTRLVTVAADLAGHADVTVLTGWCLPLSKGLPFLPVVDVLREVGELDEGRLVKSVLGECPSFVLGEIVRLMPGLAEPGEPPGAVEPEDGWRRQRLFNALRQLFQAMGQMRRVAMLIEDVQWADPTTLEFLEYLLAPGRAPGVSVVLTCRSEEAPTEELTDWLERLHRNARVDRLDLAPLTRAETAEQITLLLGEPPQRRFLDDMYRRSEGNAFFTEQLVSFARTDTADRPGAGALPAGLTALLLSRTARVTGPADQVLAVLAVAGRLLDEVALARLCGLTGPEVRAALRELLMARLLRRPDSTGGNQLSHALLAEALDGELLPEERRELHARLAQFLQTLRAGAPAAEVASHWAAAGRADAELHWRIIAARQAERLFAPGQAFVHWQRVLELWDAVGADVDRDGLDLAEAYVGALSAAESSGNAAAGSVLAEQAMDRLAGVVEGQSAVRLYRWVGLFRGMDSTEAGLATLAQAIAIAERLPPSEDYVRALRHYGSVRGNAGSFQDCRDFAFRALEAAREIGSLSGQKLAGVQLAWSQAVLGEDLSSARRDLDAAFAFSSEDPSVNVEATIGYTDLAVKLGELHRAIAVGVPVVERAVEDGQFDAFRVRLLRCNLCEAYREMGDIEAAAGILGPRPDGPPIRDWLITWGASAADVDVCRGRLESAVAFWNVNSEVFDSVPALEMRRELASSWAEACLWIGDPAAAMGRAVPTLEVIHAVDDCRFSGRLFVLALRAIADRAERVRVTGDAHALAALVLDAARVDALRAGSKVDPFGDRPVPVTAPADGLSWKAEWTRLHGGSDAGAWGQAADAWDALGRPHRAAYARWRHADALLARPHGRTEAADVLRTAAVQAVQHVPLSDAIAELARLARIELTEANPAPAADQLAPGAPFGLTERELAVLQLLGRGMTNSEIGAALFISPRTASVHVTNILRKMDVATRVHAAAVAERAGLLTD